MSTGYHRCVSYEELVESRIQEALSAGAFRNLPGEGRPLRSWDEEQLAGDQWLGFKVLRDAEMLPEWLLLAREIEQHRETLDQLDQRHENLVLAARQAGRWERLMPVVQQLRAEFEHEARTLRRKQDRFNHDAPNIRLERPGIWVEYHLERLDSRISCPIELPGDRG